MSEIKVAVRCRPFTVDDKLGIMLLQHTEQQGEVALLNSDYSTTRFPFTYAWWSAFGFEHHVQGSPPETEAMQLIDQNAMYNSCGHSVKADVLNGDAVVLFAYGLSGSGKTFTVFGPDAVDIPEAWFKHSEPHPLWGLFPRLAYELFQMRTDQWKISMKYFQNVVDTVRDLMAPEVQERSYKDGMRKDADGFMDIGWCSSVVLESWDHLRETFKRANERKAISPTQFNHQSTRGHCIMTLEVEMPDPKDEGKKQIGRLYICDLAGTEPAGDIVFAKYEKKMYPDGSFEMVYKGPHPDQSKTRDLQDQGKKINLSLSEMAQFFMKMAEAVKAKRLKPGKSIPGCNTYFLCKYLKDTILQAKTYLFCAVRPEVTYHRYTFATLGFAANASVVQLVPKRATAASSPAEQKLASELDDVKAQLAALQRQNAELKVAAEQNSVSPEQEALNSEELEKLQLEIEARNNELAVLENRAKEEDNKQRIEYGKRGITMAAYLTCVPDVPYLINLDEDQFRSKRFVYLLEKPDVVFGPGADACPLDFGVVPNHCRFQVNSNQNTITLKNGAGETFHNGLQLGTDQEVVLSTNDRIGIASELLVFINPGEQTNEFTALSVEEAFEEFRNAVCNANQTKNHLYAEKMAAFEEEQLRWEEWKKREEEASETKLDHAIIQQEKLAQALVSVNQELLQLMPVVESCESKCTLLGRSMLNLDVVLDLPLVHSLDLPKAKIRVTNKGTAETIFLEPSTFHKSHKLLADEINNLRVALENHREYTVPEAHDPLNLLFDVLAEIGSASISFDELLRGHRCAQIVDIKELSVEAADIGDIEVVLSPLKLPGNEMTPTSLLAEDGGADFENLEEILGKSWSFMIEILNVASLPFMTDMAFCQYFFNGQFFETETVQQETNSPTFNYRFVHHVDCLTLEFLEAMQRPLEIIVFASPKVCLPTERISTSSKLIQTNIFPEGCIQDQTKVDTAILEQLKQENDQLKQENLTLKQENESLKQRLGKSDQISQAAPVHPSSKGPQKKGCFGCFAVKVKPEK